MKVRTVGVLGRATLSDRLVENLARSAGIVLFYDPVSEFDRGDAFVHSYGVLAQLRSQAARRGRLPHHLAVCITKFDEIRVLESAQKLRVVEYELAREEFPQVPEEYPTNSSADLSDYPVQTTRD